MFIYLVSLGRDRIYKIGATRDLDKRMKNFGRANPWLRLVTSAKVRVNDWDELVDIEQYVHQTFDDYRWTYDNGYGNVGTELFQFDEDTLERACQYINQMDAEGSE